MLTNLIHRIGYALLKWPPVSEKARKIATNMVRSYQCPCGKHKLSGHPLCKECYNSLSQTDKEPLSKMLRRGFVMKYLSITRKKLNTRIKQHDTRITQIKQEIANGK